MIETESLILNKAVFSDWKDMYENVWSHPESAAYMTWNITTNEEDARIRIQKTIAFQKEHDTWLVYESSRRKFLIQRNFRPLTPPCVPFGTRRFNQLNK